MTRDQFMNLPLPQQYLLVKHLAVEVAQRNDDQYKYLLFQLDAFYIELKVQPVDDTLAGLVSFSSSLKLNEYLDSIDISNVFV